MYYSQNPQNAENYKPSFFQKNQKVIKIVAIISVAVFAILAVIGACVGCFYAGKHSSELPIANEVFNLINKYYYKDIPKDQLDRWSSIGLTETLDQFSGISYVSTAPTKQFGFSFKSDSYNNHIVTSISTNSPAEKAGLQRGDILLAVGNETEGYKSVVGLNRDLLNSNDFLGKGATQDIQVKVKKSDGAEKTITMRKSIFTSSEASYVNFDNKVGYIKLNSFTGTAAEDFVSCVNEFKADKNTKLILDLRDNGGGSTDILSKIASYLIHDNKDLSNGLGIIKLDSEKTKESVTYTAEGNNWLGAGLNGAFKLAVLVNENSASASEALLGAINYYCGNVVNKYKDELVVIGSPTYGKGIAQQTFPLKTTPDMVISMTVGYFKVPIISNGKQDWKSYHGESMIPDKEIPKFSSFLNFKENDYASYYNNNLKDEEAVKLAVAALA